MSDTTPRSQERSVILVDDDIAYLDLLEQLLVQHLQCPVHSFSRPVEALRALPGLNVGLIVTDYQMPALTGMDLIFEAQKLAPGASAILITAYHLKFTKDELKRVPALKSVVVKPFKWTTLAEQINLYWPSASNPPFSGGGA
jgi:two-component SAPR family response regulator